jgi:dihydropteroate synthase
VPPETVGPTLRTRTGALDVGHRTLLVGVVNVTPDSFSDGGEFHDAGDAVAHGRRLAEAGADVLDVGGESTRPGADPVPVDEERQRVLPAVEELAEAIDVPVSVDTQKAPVAREALEAGAEIVNDVTALRGDDDMADVVADHGAGLVLMHMQGTPRTMQEDPTYGDVVDDVRGFLEKRARVAEDAGVDPEAIVVDPGIGFGKTLDHNLELLRNLDAFRGLGYPVLLGHSRKSFIGDVTGAPVDEREPGTVAVTAWGVSRDVDLVRVHDVERNRQAADLVDAIHRGRHDG